MIESSSTRLPLGAITKSLGHGKAPPVFSAAVGCSNHKMKAVDESAPPAPTSPNNALVSDFVGCWYLVRCKGGLELRLIDRLAALGINYFVPMQREVIFRRGRKLKLWKALFSGYGFFCGGEAERWKIYDINLTAQDRIISITSHVAQSILRGQLRDFQSQLVVNPEVAKPKPLQPGVRVRVIGDHWACGKEGVVDEEGRNFVYIHCEFFGGRDTPFEVPRQLVEVID